MRKEKIKTGNEMNTFVIFLLIKFKGKMNTTREKFEEI